MKHIFLIFGYGTPANIFTDENYNFYLKAAFNKIYATTRSQNLPDPLIICSGGHTDLFPPYRRSEAGEMLKLLKKFSTKPALKLLTKNWRWLAETTSLSSLENLLNCREILNKEKISPTRLHLFCEQTRAARLRTLSRKIFARPDTVKIIPIDFDVSANRYLDPNFLVRKERAELKHSLWALENPANLKKHHQLFVEKIKFLRQAGPQIQVETIKKWWEEKLKQLKTHPHPSAREKS